MSYRRDVGSYSVPFVIRNLQRNPWPRFVMRACVLCSFGSICVAIVLMKQGFAREIALLLFIPVLVGQVGSLVIGCYLLATKPIDKLLLGEKLETRPRVKRWEIDEIERIEFVSSLEDDYRELDHLAHDRDTRIFLRRVSGVRLMTFVFSVADASRLREWAKQNDIPISQGHIEL